MRNFKVLFFLLLSFFIVTNTLATNNFFPDIAKIMARGTLIAVIPRPDFAPFYYVDKEGNLRGVSVRLAKDIAKKLGVKIVFKRTGETYGKDISLLSAEQADIMIGDVTKTLDRSREILFSNTYIKSKETFLVRELWLVQQRDKYLQIDDPIRLLLKSKARIGVLIGSSYAEKAVTIFPKAQIVGFSSVSDIMSALSSKKIDVVFFSDLEAKLYLLKHRKARMFLRAIVLTKQEDLVAVALAKSHVGLRHWINTYLELNNIHWDSDKIIKMSY